MNREEKKKRRKQMLAMMDEDPNWYLKEDKSEIIHAIANGFVPQKKETSVCKKKPWSSLTRVDFLYLIAQGYRKEDFLRDYDVSEYQWVVWRKQNGFCNKRNEDIRREYAEEIRNICQMKRKQQKKERTNSIVG